MLQKRQPGLQLEFILQGGSLSNSQTSMYGLLCNTNMYARKTNQRKCPPGHLERILIVGQNNVEFDRMKIAVSTSGNIALREMK